MRSIVLAVCLMAPSLAVANPLDASLEAATRQARVARGLVLTYDDLHGLHGGDRYELEGRKLLHTHKARGPAPATETRVTLTEAQLQELAQLLHAQELWEQQTVGRQARPDESRARLTMSLDGQSAEVWEWYNEMLGNDRLVRVRAALSRYAAGGAP